ncbi:MAG: polysaccharide biosynthesis tyrosine autokinase [Acidobacteriota bacterium]|nr:polysaccharide biosynthesis tyrosine autokinase [Acidobacteriota bacterium]
MSRVHDALRKAAQEKAASARPQQGGPPPAQEPTLSYSREETAAPADQVEHAAALPATTYLPDSETPSEDVSPAPMTAPPIRRAASALADGAVSDLERLEEIIRHVPVIPFTPASDALLINPAKPKDAPSEEFRSLRTRLNYLQGSQPLHTLVVSSASPGEGKSFTACNLAMSEAQLTGKRILLADFDFRRPSIEKIFGLKGTLGLTDYLLGKARIQDLIYRIADTNLYIITAGESVTNPLELLNLGECGTLLDALRDHFDWVILDSPPLLFAADGNLLSTMADGTILVVRIGTTTYDSVTRALQSLCENNVLGIVVNGAHHGELYSRYSYYHNYYYEQNNDKPEPPAENNSLEIEPVGAGKG